jgi:hypothetical protein
MLRITAFKPLKISKHEIINRLFDKLRAGPFDCNRLKKSVSAQGAALRNIVWSMINSNQLDIHEKMAYKYLSNPERIFSTERSRSVFAAAKSKDVFGTIFPFPR